MQVKRTYITIHEGVQVILFELYNGTFFLCGTATPIDTTEAKKLIYG